MANDNWTMNIEQSSMASFELIGIGNPIMDLLAHVPESFLTAHVAGEKGGMVLVDHVDI